MSKQPDKDDPSVSAGPENRAEGSKRPYRAPRLVSYGRLSDITQVKGCNKNDGGGTAPPSKA